jgi:hypothetical protein
MASSDDRSDGTPNGRRGSGAEPAPDDPPSPIERSTSGRIIIRSSSHPPTADSSSTPTDTSGAHLLPDGEKEPRVKRDTPAERPRRRRKVMAEQAAEGQRRRRDTAPALPTSLRRRSEEALDIDIEIVGESSEPAAAEPRFVSGGDAVSSLQPVAGAARRAARARALIVGAVIAAAVIVALLLWRLLAL